jgi:hypothetical protein
VKKIIQTSLSNLLFDIRNAREIRLHKDDDKGSFIHTTSNNKILSIQYADVKIAINEDFIIDEESYHISEIYENDEFYTFYVSKINKITLFSLPMFFDNRDTASTSSLINVYYGDNHKNDLYFHYRYNSEPPFKETERILTNSEYFINEIDIDNFHTVYQTQIPTEYTSDFDKIINGKYSKISSKFKVEIIKFHNLKPNKYLYQVINRDKKLLDKMEKDLDTKIPDDIDLMSKINLDSVNYNAIKTISNE